MAVASHAPLAPASGRRRPGPIPDDAGNKRAELFLSVDLAINALDPNVRSQVNRVPGPAVSSPQRELKRDLAAGEEDTGQPGTRVGEGGSDARDTAPSISPSALRS